MSPPPVMVIDHGIEPDPSWLGQISVIRSQHRTAAKLEITFPSPDGPVEIWTWTRRGVELGDQADLLASFYGLSLADLVAIADRYTTVSFDGAVRIAEIRLAPVIDRIRAGDRTDSLTGLGVGLLLATHASDGTPAPALAFGPELALARSRTAERGA